MRDGLVGVQQPEQTQEPDKDDLAYHWVAVDEKSDYTAHHSSFDQVNDRHNTRLAGRHTAAFSRPRYKASVCASTTAKVL